MQTAKTLLTLAIGLAASATLLAGPTLPGRHEALAAKPPAPTATPVPTAVPPCQGCPPMHVVLVRAAGTTRNNGTNGLCEVAVADEGGSFLSGATVNIQWSGAYNGPGSGVTVPDQFGSASAWIRVSTGEKCSSRNPHVIYTCTVTNVTHPDFTWVPQSGDPTTDSDDACSFTD